MEDNCIPSDTEFDCCRTGVCPLTLNLTRRTNVYSLTLDLTGRTGVYSLKLDQTVVGHMQNS